MNVDDAIRDFRTSVRGPAERLVDEIVAAAPSTRRVRSRPRVTGRTVVVATSVSMAFLVVVTLAIVLRGGNRPDPAPATPVVPPARVAWGMVATVKLTPDPGVSIEEMRERFARALAFRVHDDDGAGVEIIDQRDDTVRVRLPGAELEAQAKGYLRFSRLVLVDEATDVLASGPRLRSLKAAAQKLIGPSTPTAYYVQMVEGGGKAVSQPTRFDSRSKASAVARRIGASFSPTTPPPIRKPRWPVAKLAAHALCASAYLNTAKKSATGRKSKRIFTTGTVASGAPEVPGMRRTR